MKGNCLIDSPDENDNLKHKFGTVVQPLEIAMSQSTATYSAAPSFDSAKKVRVLQMKVVEDQHTENDEKAKATITDTAQLYHGLTVIGSEAVATSKKETTTGEEVYGKLFEERANQYLSDGLLHAIEVHVG